MCKIVDFSIPQDSRVKQGQDGKFEKFHDLARKIRRTWQVKLKVITLIVGALGTIQRASKLSLPRRNICCGFQKEKRHSSQSQENLVARTKDQSHAFILSISGILHA